MTLLVRNGYAKTTMKQLADELGVSVRTLHRYFPSKADLVWGSLERSFPELRERLVDSPADQSIIAAMGDAILALFDETLDAFGAGRLWFEVVVGAPELRSAPTDAIDQWRADLAAFAAGRLGVEADSLEPVALAAAAQAATLDALTWWSAHQNEMSPADAVRRAFEALRTESQ